MTSVDLNLRAWRKSSYSSGNNNCVEIAELRDASAVWRKSSYSGNDGGNCVEVGAAPGARGVRDSKLGESSPVLAFSRDAWASFLGKVKAGGFRQ
ncbi:DUF397 domain-containing protein [Saccharopolyspora shandongensis]|uniref:DUF397 domain-containing protein n=1 Tax=Saccharopolyspora shandongensis TaxID=418495 RepID=UPI00341002E5